MDNSPSQPSRLVRRLTPHLSDRHLLAPVAARHCAGHAVLPPSHYLGRVACGACWERAIRDDERAVVLFDVPRELAPDPDLVDEVAVERAVAGRPVELTTAEQRAAVRRLARTGLTVSEIAEQIRIRIDAVHHYLIDPPLPRPKAA